jgi:hypothetical protein
MPAWQPLAFGRCQSTSSKPIWTPEIPGQQSSPTIALISGAARSNISAAQRSRNQLSPPMHNNLLTYDECFAVLHNQQLHSKGILGLSGERPEIFYSNG